ncbi:MAG: PepSY domain-containing protein, partial [Deltaproteobacteria bacterium]|nr:PepSY domain-containing protein [Deltaproteobacteria bacterium]
MSAERLYGVVWRWHFLAGLAACPIVFVVALTGALYTFQPELDPIVDPELLVVEPAPARAAVEAVVAVAGERCAVTGIVLPPARGRAAVAYCTDERQVFVDPYRARVLGERAPHGGVFGTISGLHWELLLGEPGRIAVEWATSWAVLLMLSGAVLWWPRGKRRGGGVLWPRARLSGRQWLRDLHAVLGAYALPVLFVLAATGLMWTVHAGDGRW